MRGAFDRCDLPVNRGFGSKAADEDHRSACRGPGSQYGAVSVPPAETFFGRVNKTVILNAAAEAHEEAKARKLDVLKKPVMAAEAVNMISGTGWLPPVLRTKGRPIGHAHRNSLAPPLLAPSAIPRTGRLFLALLV